MDSPLPYVQAVQGLQPRPPPCWQDQRLDDQRSVVPEIIWMWERIQWHLLRTPSPLKLLIEPPEISWVLIFMAGQYFSYNLFCQPFTDVVKMFYLQALCPSGRCRLPYPGREEKIWQILITCQVGEMFKKWRAINFQLISTLVSWKMWTVWAHSSICLRQWSSGIRMVCYLILLKILSFKGMWIRSLLTAMDHNLSRVPEHAVTLDGKLRFKTSVRPFYLHNTLPDLEPKLLNQA